MAAVKNGIKCTLRTPLKTILFSVVLIFLSALLTVSLSVYTAVRTYLDDCGDYFHTIAKLEYIGSDYPNASVCDPTLGDAVRDNETAFSELLHTKGVRAFEADSNAAAIVDGMHRWDNFVYAPDKAVLKLLNQVYDERHNTYMMIVSEALYSRKNYTNKLIIVRSDAALYEGAERLKAGKTYYMVGEFFRGDSSNPWFNAEPVSFRDGEQTVTLPAVWEEDASDPLCEAYARYAGQLRMINDSCRVQYSAALEDEPRFHQQILSVSEGRMFTAEEYQTRASVCIVPQQIAGAAGLSIGDRIDLTVYHADGDLYDPNTWRQNDAGGYEIVGIFSGTEHNAYQIFLPDAAAASRGVVPVTGYLLGAFRLENDSVEAFLAAAEPLTEQGFRVTVYDQGYAAATEPMQELLLIAVIFLAVCLLLTVAAHALQSHLFIFRQRETARTMDALGSGKLHVMIYFLCAALLLVLIASAAGVFIAKGLEQRVFAVLQRFASQFADADLRFSDSRLSLTRTLAFEPVTPVSVYLLSVGLMLFGSVLFTSVFALQSLKDARKAKRRRRAALQRVAVYSGKSSRLSGKLKYALLSMRRGVVRSTAVLLLCAIVAVFFGQLCFSLDGYHAQLEIYRSNATIHGFATNLYGQLEDGLAVKGKTIQRLVDSGLLSSYTVSDALTYCLPLGVAEKADGGACEPPVYAVPTNAFVLETLEYNISQGMRIVNTTSVSESSILHHAKVKDIAWLEGYSESSFVHSHRSIGALPKSLMEEYGFALGDTVRFLAIFGDIVMIDVKIVASYAAKTVTPVLYMPILAEWKPVYIPDASDEYLSVGDGESVPVETNVPDDAGPDAEPEEQTGDPFARYPSLRFHSFDSFRFTLDRAEDLDALRQALDESGFTYVHSGVRSKPFAIIEDEMYLNTTHSMERQIQYVGVLYDALYAIAGVIGFVLAWLLTLSRRQEIAVMRAMGTQPLRILLNFAFEQAALSVLGMLIGCAISVLLGCTLSPLFLILCAAFLGVWNLATLLCLIVGLLKPSYASLTEPE